MNSDFVFWNDINKPKRYEEVIPDRKLGRVVLRLYDRIKNNTLNSFFKHADLEAIYWEVNPTKERKTREITQYAIEQLKHYFISYDADRQEYHLRDYAYEFGKMVYTLLEAQFNPSQVEKLCKILKENLEKHIESATFKDWYLYIFQPNYSDLRRQLDLLDEKIDLLVRDLGLQRLDDEDVLKMLRSVSDRLERLLIEYRQLEAAYKDTRFIHTQLIKYQNQALEMDVPNVEYAISFLSNLRRLLDAIRVRLNRIQPKIQQLFGVFQQANFRARTDQFIRYLFESSTLRTNKVVLPAHISPFICRIHKLQFWYFDVNRNVFPEPPQPRTPRLVDEVARKQAFQKAGEPARRQDEAHTWLERFHADLENNGTLSLSDYFDRIYRKDPQQFDIVLRFSYLVLRRYSNHVDWQLKVKPPTRQHSYPNLLLWNIHIYRKNSDSPLTLPPKPSSPN